MIAHARHTLAAAGVLGALLAACGAEPGHHERTDPAPPSPPSGASSSGGDASGASSSSGGGASGASSSSSGDASGASSSSGGDASGASSSSSGDAGEADGGSDAEGDGCVPIGAGLVCQGRCGLLDNGCGTAVYDCLCPGDPAFYVCLDDHTCCVRIPRVEACAGIVCGTADNGCAGTWDCGACP